MRSVVIHPYAVPNALSSFLQGLLLVAHELIKRELVAEPLPLVGSFTAHRHACSSAATDRLHDFPVEDEVHLVAHVERGVR